MSNAKDVPADPELPSLDYAYLAEFAQVQPNGTLTAVGASFTHIAVGEVPTSRLVSVAGRVRVAEHSGPITLNIVIAGPGPNAPVISVEMLAAHGPERAYRGRAGVLFALTTAVPIVSEGLHTVTLSLEGKVVRLLAFEAEVVRG